MVSRSWYELVALTLWYGDMGVDEPNYDSHVEHPHNYLL